jgi:hypothetical protein
MSAPCKSDWDLLKKLARYLKSHPRMIMKFEYQKPVDRLNIIVDTDYAGCRRTRRSTNGGWLCWETT